LHRGVFVSIYQLSLQHALSDAEREAQYKEQQKDNNELTPCEQKIVNKYVAMSNADRENDLELKFLKRHTAISFVTSDIIPDNKYRAQCIDSLARGSVPLHECWYRILTIIENEFNRAVFL
jgi:hypothetical protein